MKALVETNGEQQYGYPDAQMTLLHDRPILWLLVQSSSRCGFQFEALWVLEVWEEEGLKINNKYFEHSGQEAMAVVTFITVYEVAVTADWK